MAFVAACAQRACRCLVASTASDRHAMQITLQCPKLTCRAIVQVPVSVRGKRVRCAQCGTMFTVPGKPGETAAGSGVSSGKTK